MEREELNFFIQKAPEQEVLNLHRKIEEMAVVKIIQQPTAQTLLVPVKDPITGGEFLSGEVLVTSSIVQVNGANGWAMVMDDNPKIATMTAVIDGAYAADICLDEIVRVAEKGKAEIALEREKTNQQIAGTKVAFDLL